MNNNSENISKLLATPFPYLRDINLGIVLIGIFFLFDFGSFQGLYPIFNKLKLPYILAASSISYALYLIISTKIDFSAGTTVRFSFLCIFAITYAILSTKFPTTRSIVIKSFLVYLAYYLIIITCVKTTSQFILLIDIWLASILCSSYHGIMQGGLVWSNKWMCDENELGLLAAMAIPFAFFLWHMYNSLLRKLFYLICLIFYVTAIVVSISRTAAVSAVVVIFCCWLLSNNKIRNLGIIIIVVTILVVNFAPPQFLKEMQSLQQGTQESTAADRIYLWGFCFRMFNDHPILGVGPLNYPYYFSHYEKGVKYPIDSYRVPHSTPLQWLAEMGIVGMLLLFMLQRSMYSNWKLLYVYRKQYPTITESRDLMIYELLTQSIAIAQIGFWVGSIFLSLIPYPFYWILIPFSESWKNISVRFMENVMNVSER